MDRRLIGAVAGLATVLAVAGVTPASATDQSVDTAHRSAFVVRDSDDLELGGKPFGFAGSNNYYLMYKTPAMVDDAANFNVLRTWGFLDVGTPADAGSNGGVYLQFCDGALPAYNADYLRAE